MARKLMFNNKIIEDEVVDGYTMIKSSDIVNNSTTTYYDAASNCLCIDMSKAQLSWGCFEITIPHTYFEYNSKYLVKHTIIQNTLNDNLLSNHFDQSSIIYRADWNSKYFFKFLDEQNVSAYKLPIAFVGDIKSNEFSTPSTLEEFNARKNNTTLRYQISETATGIIKFKIGIKKV